MEFEWVLCDGLYFVVGVEYGVFLDYFEVCEVVG